MIEKMIFFQDFFLKSDFILTLGYESDDYHQVWLKFRGDSINVRVHQLMYWVKNDFVALGDPTKQISHLCHLASCAKMEHLVYESSQLNNARKLCKKAKKCQGHGDENPFCLI